jgi:predicted nucleic acid-binding protein
MRISSEVAVLDACVLYPPRLRDLLMWLAVHGLYEPKWTTEIHEEWIENVLEADAKKNNPPRFKRENLEKTRNDMNRAIPRALIKDYAHWIPTLTLPDEDDKHVLAAAIEANASLIVTENIKDFPATALAPYGIKAIRPDKFLAELYDANPDLFMQAVSAMLSAKKTPPVTLEELCGHFKKSGLNALVTRLDVHLDNQDN